MNGITYIADFITTPDVLFKFLKNNVVWDERMSARKTASYGEAYNYSQISYPYQAFTKELEEIIDLIEKTLNFAPNNCLINYYLDGKSSMGFHSDQTDILVENTGVGIVSIGETRILRFRNIKDKTIIKDFELPSGSFIYMTNEVQDEWQHAIPKSDTENGRMSLTFRMMTK
ncbi:alpha-ketoglutarate-dependent dioxygenase AlkB [Kordia sp. YSTF-M3]|uniref:Alpha-ketoglutarate-dependent dioxygenase AlkB n=1 Tax=Kordia aestuariivivens TaxID=2759037 RepID=A0ABR7Q9H7_9FLAO|nr:alpha-ketoglutarate-dependent dioxygenase AlkB [Kordia aestuariivivens]MBC8755216.1 alpha-ketoglutarate-dependent dioxygenase AlkB [Kordia aestuariivivens]